MPCATIFKNIYRTIKPKQRPHSARVTLYSGGCTVYHSPYIVIVCAADDGFNGCSSLVM